MTRRGSRPLRQILRMGIDYAKAGAMPAKHAIAKRPKRSRTSRSGGLEKTTDTMNSPASAFRWRKQPSARASCGPSVRAVRCSRASRAPALEGCLPAASASVAAHQARRGVRARWWHIAAGLSWTGQLTLSRSGTRRAFAIFALTLSGSGTRRPIAIFALTLPPVPGRRIIAVVEAVIGPSAAVGRTFIPVVGPAPILCPGRQPRIGLDQCRWGAHRCGG